MLPIVADGRNGSAAYDARIAIARAARFGTGTEITKHLHDYILRYMARTFD